MYKKSLWLFLTVFVLLFTIAPLSAQQANAITVYATAQQFEHGLMIWRADNSDIWVLADDGQALLYSTGIYESLADNPIFGTPPSRLRPIFGFGKVWGNDANVRALLGWPTLPEIGFNMPVSFENAVYYFTQLDRSTIVIYADRTWTRVNLYPRPAPARVVDFTANADAVLPGGTLFLNWAVEGVEFAILDLYLANSNTPFTSLSDLPAAGSATITVPDNASDSVRLVLSGARRTRPNGFVAVIERLVQSTLNIPVRPFPTPITTTTYAAFQQYEHGFMIWRADTGAVYAFYQGGLWGNWFQSVYEGLSDSAISAPAGLVSPVNGFGRVWGNFQDVRDRLGWATGVEQGYQMTVTRSPGPPLFTDPYTFTLPDGRVLYFVHYGAYWGVQ